MFKALSDRKRKILLLFAIFIFSLILRLWNLNLMGRTWDESAYVEVGNKFVKLLEKGDFLNDYFFKWVDEPPLARYIYGIFSIYDENHDKSGSQFNYDYTYARFSSALISSLSVAVVVLIGFEFISTEIGIYSGIILSMLPLFVGYSQIATLESVLFFTFTSSIYASFKFLKKSTYKNSLILGFFIGLAVLSKFTNILVVPLIFIIFALYKRYTGKYIKEKLKKGLTVFAAAAITFFALWPMPLFNIGRVLSYSIDLRTSLGKYPSIEVFFGKLIHVPHFYYFVFFIITTPILILILFFFGAKYISNYGKKPLSKEKKWIFYSLIIWFCLPFLQSFYNFRHQGIRFIIEIYAPLALIAGIGVFYVTEKFKLKDFKKIVFFSFVILYSFFVLLRITPYYLDYFNVVVGGTKTVYEKGLFQIGWWGQGLREAGYFVKDNIKEGQSVGLAISPEHVFPKLQGVKVSEFSQNKKYDFVVVNSFHVLREGFDDSYIKSHYKLIYTVKADGGVLVYVYKRI